MARWDLGLPGVLLSTLAIFNALLRRDNRNRARLVKSASCVRHGVCAEPVCGVVSDGLNRWAPALEAALSFVQGIAGVLGMLKCSPLFARCNWSIVQQVDDFPRLFRQKQLLLGFLDNGGSV